MCADGKCVCGFIGCSHKLSRLRMLRTFQLYNFDGILKIFSFHVRRTKLRDISLSLFHTQTHINAIKKRVMIQVLAATEIDNFPKANTPILFRKKLSAYEIRGWLHTHSHSTDKQALTRVFSWREMACKAFLRAANISNIDTTLEIVRLLNQHMHASTLRSYIGLISHHQYPLHSLPPHFSS